jgi:uncharacterized protein YpuA (DUF1002 family)
MGFNVLKELDMRNNEEDMFIIDNNNRRKYSDEVIVRKYTNDEVDFKNRNEPKRGPGS